MEGRRRGYDQDSTIAATIEKSERKALMMELYEREAVQPSYALTEETLRAFSEYQYDIEVLSQHIVAVVKSAQKKHYKNCAMGRFESLVVSYSTQNIITRFGPKGWVGWFKIGDVLDPLKEPLRTMEVNSLYPRPALRRWDTTYFACKSGVQLILMMLGNPLRNRRLYNCALTIWSVT